MWRSYAMTAASLNKLCSRTSLVDGYYHFAREPLKDKTVYYFIVFASYEMNPWMPLVFPQII